MTPRLWKSDVTNLVLAAYTPGMKSLTRSSLSLLEISMLAVGTPSLVLPRLNPWTTLPESLNGNLSGTEVSQVLNSGKTLASLFSRSTL